MYYISLTYDLKQLTINQKWSYTDIIKKNLFVPGIPGIPGILKIIFRSTGKSKGREIENPNRILLYVKDFKHDATTNSPKSKDLRKNRRR